MKRVLVLGARGFIGSNTLAYLDKDYDVLRCTEDIRDIELIAPYFKGVEFVVHAAGESKDQTNEELCFETNVTGTKNIIKLCIENKCKLIHFSSTARKLAYGRSKQVSQKLVEDNAIYNGLKVIILRLCPIVTLDSPLMVWGRRYPIENLVKDIETIIRTHDFNKYKLIDYKKFKSHEESPHLHQSRT